MAICDSNHQRMSLVHIQIKQGSSCLHQPRHNNLIPWVFRVITAVQHKNNELVMVDKQQEACLILSRFPTLLRKLWSTKRACFYGLVLCCFKAAVSTSGVTCHVEQPSEGAASVRCLHCQSGSTDNASCQQHSPWRC